MSAKGLKPQAEWVEICAKVRGKPPVDRRYIDEAIRLVDMKQEYVPRYNTGRPTLPGLYALAVRLKNAAATMN